mmetsp:Transcript_2775/g.8157  ORF Transcript_2775/g.8157 Transcript_2775/m.8157 type:complete len:217 (+) Transcript_2775:2124-2774(+)
MGRCKGRITVAVLRVPAVDLGAPMLGGSSSEIQVEEDLLLEDKLPGQTMFGPLLVEGEDLRPGLLEMWRSQPAPVEVKAAVGGAQCGLPEGGQGEHRNVQVSGHPAQLLLAGRARAADYLKAGVVGLLRLRRLVPVDLNRQRHLWAVASMLLLRRKRKRKGCSSSTSSRSWLINRKRSRSRSTCTVVDLDLLELERPFRFNSIIHSFLLFASLLIR